MKTVPNVSMRGDAMLSYRGRLVYVLWEDKDEGDEMEAGFGVFRLLADKTISMVPGLGRTRSFLDAIERAKEVVGLVPTVDITPFWEDVASTELDTRKIRAV